MTSVWDRRKPRITYQVPVGVYDLGQERVLSVSSINVSLGGMFVDTTVSLDIGTELVCNLPVGVGNDALQIRGRVAWLRGSQSEGEQRPIGMGIEFVDLSEKECGQLSDIVGDKEETSHPVRMKLSGMGAPVKACAKLTEQGIFIRAPLPFLSQDSRVDFSFLGSEEESHRGRIIGVEIHRDEDSQVPRLQVEIELDSIGHEELALPENPAIPENALSGVERYPEDGDLAPEYVDVEDTMKTENVFLSEKPDIEASEEGEWEELAHRSPADQLDEPDSSLGWGEEEYEPENHVAFERRPLWPIAAAILVVVGGALAFGLNSGQDDAKASGVSSASDGTSDGSLFNNEFEPVVAIAAGPTNNASPDRALEKAGQFAVEVNPEPQQESDSEVESDRVHLAEVVAEVPVVRPVPVKKTRETIHGLRIEDGGELVFRLPFRGSDERFSSYALANPPGIAVNLPYAQPNAGFVESAIPKNSKVRRIWIRERLGGLHFRLFFSDASQECKATVKKSNLVIRCQSKS